MSERDELILSLLDYVTPLLRQYTAKYRRVVSFEDLYQDASIHIMRLIDAGTPAQELQRYAYNRVRSRIIDKLKYLRRRQAQSLDAPMFEQGEVGPTLADLLPGLYSHDPLSILLAKARIQALLSHISTLPDARAALARELGATALASLPL